MDRREKSNLIVKYVKMKELFGWGKTHGDRGTQVCKYFEKQAKETQKKITKLFQLLELKT